MNAPETVDRRPHSNRTWDELAIGDHAELGHSVTDRDLYLFAHASGNRNPVHMPGSDVDGDGVVDTVAPSLWLGSLVSTVLGNLLPGAGTLYRTQYFEFGKRARLGDQLKIRVEVVEKLDRPRVAFDTQVCLADGTVLARGRAEVDAPLERITVQPGDLPRLMMDSHDSFLPLLTAARNIGPMTMAVVWPDDANSLGGALLAAREGLIRPILVGRRADIEKAASALGESTEGCEFVEAQSSDLAAARAVALVHEGRAKALMKGNLHSDELLGYVVRKDGGLRTGRRISHVFVLDVPTLEHLLFITDAAINIAPDLQTKVDITQNAIDLAHACGVVEPRVGILSAVETVNLNIPSSMDAAIIAKMADRGQIKGAIVDGPLAMDNAIDVGAARTKKLQSKVAGHAEVLVVPNLEAGNMLAKQLAFLSAARTSGLVVGAGVPIVLTSRADDDDARLVSCALALLYAHMKAEGKAALTSAPSPSDA